jgi:nitrate reductase assembly molybdenum cofactor insertion protein NarJ
MGNYMRNHGTREILMKKAQLIAAIKQNKAVHIKAYAKAIIAYKKEALKQLAEQTKAAKEGKLTIFLNLTSPVSLVEHYDELVEMFEIDVREELTLTQQEYNEYYKDKTENTRHAMMSNQMYLG